MNIEVRSPSHGMRIEYTGIRTCSINHSRETTTRGYNVDKQTTICTVSKPYITQNQTGIPNVGTVAITQRTKERKGFNLIDIPRDMSNIPNNESRSILKTRTTHRKGGSSIYPARRWGSTYCKMPGVTSHTRLRNRRRGLGLHNIVST